MAFIVRDRSGKVIGSTKLRSGATVKVGGSSKSSGSSSSSRSGGSSSSKKSTPKTKLVGTTKSGKRIYERDGEKYTIQQGTGKSIPYSEPSKKPIPSKPKTPDTSVFSKARGGQSFLGSRIASDKGIKQELYKTITFEEAKKVKDKPKGLKEAIKREEIRRKVFVDPGKSTFYTAVKDKPKSTITQEPTIKKTSTQDLFKAKPLTTTEKKLSSKIAEGRISRAKDISLGGALVSEIKQTYKPIYDVGRKGVEYLGSFKKNIPKTQKAFKSTARFGLTSLATPYDDWTITGKKGKTAAEVTKKLFDPEKEKAREVFSSEWRKARESKKGDTIFGEIKREYKAPGGKEKLAGGILTGVELFGPEIAFTKIPKLSKSLYYKKFGKYIDPKTIYSEEAMKSAKGIDLTYNPSKTIKQFEKSEELVKGTGLEGVYPEGYKIGTSSTGRPWSVKRFLSKTELGEPMTETGGPFFSPVQAGQPLFLRISGETAPVKLSLNPFKALSPKSKPIVYTTGVKEVKEFPKRLLRKDKDVFTDIEAFQRSRVGKSELYVTRESSLGIKKEPETVGNVGQEIRDIFTNKPLYTKIKGEVVPIKPIEIIEDATKSSDLAKLGVYKAKTATAKDIAKISGEYYSDFGKSYTAPPYGSILKSAYSRTSPAKSSYSTVSSLSDIGVSSRTSGAYRYVESSPTVSSTSYKSSTSSISSTSPSPSKSYPSGISSSTSTSPSKSTGTSPSVSSPTYSSSSVTSSPSRSLKSMLTSTASKSTRATPRFSLDSGESDRGIKKTQPYKIQVKTGNKWVSVKDKTKRNYYSAFNKAARLVDSYKERSFRLRPAKGKATKIANNFTVRKAKFYQPGKSRSLKGAYIEKSKYAIDSYNELRGITYKGLQAQRKKRSIF
jgi:hypothetical protein